MPHNCSELKVSPLFPTTDAVMRCPASCICSIRARVPRLTVREELSPLGPSTLSRSPEELTPACVPQHPIAPVYESSSRLLPAWICGTSFDMEAVEDHRGLEWNAPGCGVSTRRRRRPLMRRMATTPVLLSRPLRIEPIEGVGSD
jgi:hypothetical protein